MSIYTELKELESMIDDCFDPETGEILPEDDEAYSELKKELLSGGLEKLAKVRANKQSTVDGIDAEIERLKKAKARQEKSLAWIESYMMFLYTSAEKDSKGKVQAGTFTIGTRKSTSVNVSDDFNDERFIKIVETKKIDKVAIKNAIVAGEIVEGASLVENQNLTVK